MNDRPVGKRYSHVYLERGTPTQDSARFRRRLLRAFHEADTDRIDFHGLLEGELGVHIDYLGYGWDWENFFTTAALRDVLDAITVVYAKLHSAGYTKARVGETPQLRSLVRRTLDIRSMPMLASIWA